MSTRTIPGFGAALLAAVLLLSATPSQAQDLHPSRRPSPIGIASTFLDGTYVKVTYGRPYVRNRNIFGASTTDGEFVVPYGQVWRTGANEATEITITGPILFAGERLEAGTYSIFTEPGPNDWIIHVSPHLGLDGTGLFDPGTQTFTPVFDPADDVLTVTVPSRQIEDEVDQFTIAFEAAGNASEMTLTWELTQVRIPIAPAN